MSSDTCLIYATFDGIGNYLHGIGSQTDNFLASVKELRGHPDAVSQYDVRVAYPVPSRETVGFQFDQNAADFTLAAAAECGVHPIPLNFTSDFFWQEDVWDQVSRQLLHWVKANAHHYDKVVVVAVDAVYLRVSDRTLLDIDESVRRKLTVVHALYSSEKVPGMTPVPGRLKREQQCIHRVNTQDRVYVTDIGDYFTNHLHDQFGLTATPLPFKQSVALSHPAYEPMNEKDRRRVLEKHGVTLDRQTIVYAGRSDPIKGFDILLDACAQIDLDFQLVAIVVPYGTHDEHIDAHLAQLQKVEYAHTVRTDFSRDLLRALCQSAPVRTMVCPSRGEPVGALPHETALWAADGGPVVIAAETGGLPEQIEHGATGLLFDVRSPDTLVDALRRVLTLSEAEHRAMRVHAANKAHRERDMAQVLKRMLSLLSDEPRHTLHTTAE